VLNVAQLSKKALPPTIGHLMANSIVYPAVNPSTGGFFQLQLMRKFTRVLEILSPVEQQILYFPAWYSKAFLAL